MEAFITAIVALYQLEEWQRARASRISTTPPQRLYQLEEWQRARAVRFLLEQDIRLYQLEEWQRARARLDRKTAATDCRNDLCDALRRELGFFWNVCK